MDPCARGVGSAADSSATTAELAGDVEQPAIKMAQIVTTAINTGSADTGVTQIVEILVGGGLADWAGVTRLLPDGGGFHTTSQTSELVSIVDALQYSCDEGPCVHVATHAEIITSDQLGSDPRWPTWGPKAAQAGVTAVLSVPLHSQRVRFGAMNLYRGGDRRLGQHDRQLAELAANHVSALLAYQRMQHHLERAIDARTTVGQAQGVLMERFHLSADQAFNTLRRYSQDGNIKLQVIAEQIVTTRRLPNNITTPGQPLPGNPAASPDGET